MKNYIVIGENQDIGEKVFFSGSKRECIDWIFDRCDVGDLYRNPQNCWTGEAYYEERNAVFKIAIDKFYR